MELIDLHQYLKKISKNGVCLAFSGGVDSTVLLKICKNAGLRTEAVFFHTPLHSAGDLVDAKKIANEIDVPLKIFSIDVFENPAILQNPHDRCYICKKALFQNLCSYAKERALETCIDGTNADDLLQYRPGIRALRELGIKSPLAELGISKIVVREFAKQLELTVQNKPSAPCLATRFPYNTTFNKKDLQKVDEAESYLKNMGIQTCRLRVHGNLVRLEVNPSDFANVLKNKDKLIEKLHQLGYTYITLDLQGFRSGSMDVHDN